jgi:ADP-ribosylglycohydrolase
MYAVMSESQSPADFTSRINPSRGVTSGGAMRAAPFGLLPSINDVKALTILQASLTHNTKAGITSALAVGLATHFFHYHGRKEKLEPFLDRHLGANWLSAENGYDEDPNNGLKIISHAINAIKQSSTLSQVLVNGMSQARIADTDTICAVAMAIASRCDQFKNDLDPMLGKTLENGPYGSDFLKRLDGQLLQKFPGFDQYRSFDLNPGREFKYVPG